jgi:hypothetical protein
MAVGRKWETTVENHVAKVWTHNRLRHYCLLFNLSPPLSIRGPGARTFFPTQQRIRIDTSLIPLISRHPVQLHSMARPNGAPATGTIATNGHVASPSLTASTERIQIVNEEKNFTSVGHLC